MFFRKCLKSGKILKKRDFDSLEKTVSNIISFKQ